MTMHNKGFSKTKEEIGELIIELGKLLQILGKYQAYPDVEHPDGLGNTKLRLQDEMGDVFASIQFLITKLKLDNEIIIKRTGEKFTKYLEWDKPEELPEIKISEELNSDDKNLKIIKFLDADNDKNITRLISAKNVGDGYRKLLIEFPNLMPEHITAFYPYFNNFDVYNTLPNVNE